MITALLVLVSIVLVILLTSRFKFNAFFSLVIVALVLAMLTVPAGQVVPTLKEGFGHTLAAIGLLIIFGTTIGVILDKTRATYAMANYVLKLTGKEKTPRAIAITGFITGLPIFCDSGFIVLSGLSKSLAKASSISMVRMAGSLGIALYTLHCLIPPHPGITAAAGIVGGSLGKLILLGITVAIPTAVAGYAWVKFASRNYDHQADSHRESKDLSGMQLPDTFMSFLPVVLPLLMITGNSLREMLPYKLPSLVVLVMKFVGDPVIALLIGVFLALLLVRKGEFHKVNEMLADSIEKAGPILAIIAAGGVFGAVIKATGMGEQVSSLLSTSKLGLFVPFILAAVLKTAQGSSTVAAITSASIITPMLEGLGLQSEWARTLVLLSIGSGSMMVSHANDAYFWVVTRFSDIQPDDTLKVYSSATAVISITSFTIIWVLSFILV